MSVFKELREFLGWNVREMAEEVELSHASWSFYESGTNTPRPEVAWRIIHLARHHGFRRLTLEDFYPEPQQ